MSSDETNVTEGKATIEQMKQMRARLDEKIGEHDDALDEAAFAEKAPTMPEAEMVREAARIMGRRKR